MKRLIISSMIIASFSVQAKLDIKNFGDINQADARLIVGIGSRHFDKIDHMILNENNPSIGVEAWDIQVIYVSKNSWNKPSIYVTWAPDYVVNDYLTITGQIGIATGYKNTNSVTSGDMTYHTEYGSNSGIVVLPAVTVEYHPLANEFAVSVSVNPEVAMFSVSYSFN